MKDKARRLTLAVFNIDRSYSVNEKKRRKSRAEMNLMYALGDGNPHSQTELSHDWLVPKSTVNTVVKRWEKAGYAVQIPVPGKQREMQIALTQEGREYVSRYNDPISRAEVKALQETIDCYSDGFIDALEYFSKALREAFQEEFREESK